MKRVLVLCSALALALMGSLSIADVRIVDAADPIVIAAQLQVDDHVVADLVAARTEYAVSVSGRAEAIMQTARSQMIPQSSGFVFATMAAPRSSPHRSPPITI